MKKILQAYVRAMGKKEGTLVGAIGSTDAPDRYGEIVDQETWDLKSFKKNPILLWAHNSKLPPIGRVVKSKVLDGKLVFDAEFDMNDEFAASIYRKYKDGFLNAFSVGFIPKTFMTEDEKGKMLKNPILKDNELLEISAVPVPANPEALNNLAMRSFATKEWDDVIKEFAEEKEVEGESTEETTESTEETTTVEDGDKDATTEEVETEKELDAIADRVSQKLAPTLTKLITDLTKPKAEEKGGEDSTPKKTELVAQTPRSIRLLREATKLLQGALAEANKSRKLV